METNEHKILKVNNISNFDFTPDMGAMYDGVSYPLRAGGHLLAPYTVAHHLAKHLANQIILQKAPIRDEKETDGKGSQRALITEEAIDELKSKILTDAYEEEKQPVLTPAQVTANKMEELNKNADPETPAKEGYKDKAEVIAELEKRGITFNARLGKVKLEELLK